MHLAACLRAAVRRSATGAFCLLAPAPAYAQGGASLAAAYDRFLMALGAEGLIYFAYFTGFSIGALTGAGIVLCARWLRRHDPERSEPDAAAR